MGENKIGVYEKALSSNKNLLEIFRIFRKTNFDYLEISIDDTAEKLSRLEISRDEIENLKNYMHDNEIIIYSIVLSANRSFPLGSIDNTLSNRGKEIMKKSIDLAYNLQVPIIQVAGYYAPLQEKRNGNEKLRFIENMKEITEYAAWRGVMLGIENVDGKDILSIDDSMSIVKEVNSPWLNLYPDVGNIVANGLSLTDELNNIVGHTLCIHLKDTKNGIFRRIRFGEGFVDFELVSKTLKEQGYRGNYTLEMWNDDTENYIEILEKSLSFLKNKMNI